MLLVHESLVERKRLLDAVIVNPPHGVVAISHVLADGEWLYASAVALGLEGIVRKRLASTYQFGTRSLDWLKIKPKRAVPAQRFSRRPKANSAS